MVVLRYIIPGGFVRWGKDESSRLPKFYRHELLDHKISIVFSPWNCLTIIEERGFMSGYHPNGLIRDDGASGKIIERIAWITFDQIALSRVQRDSKRARRPICADTRADTTPS